MIFLPMRYTFYNMKILGRFIHRSFGRSTHNLFLKMSCVRRIERISPNQSVVTTHSSGSQPIGDVRFSQYGAYSSFKNRLWVDLPNDLCMNRPTHLWLY